MKLPICVLVAFVLSSPITAQHLVHNQPAAKKATLMAGLGDLLHPVSTNNAEAQKFFDQGMRLIFAFNHEEAAGSFERAAALDPKLAMAFWGLAEAVGPNYNDPADPDRYKKAHEAIAKAGALATHGSPREKHSISTLSATVSTYAHGDDRHA